VITKLLYLLSQGETVTKVEATEVLFYMTKLFQSRDMGLRRMVYLIIKELSPPAYKINQESVKRWSNEVQEAVQLRATLVQFHALALLHQ
ncbi:hypothetical protein UlMin_033347, partial [Ulmus minor]